MRTRLETKIIRHRCTSPRAWPTTRIPLKERASGAAFQPGGICKTKPGSMFRYWALFPSTLQSFLKPTGLILTEVSWRLKSLWTALPRNPFWSRPGFPASSTSPNRWLLPTVSYGHFPTGKTFGKPRKVGSSAIKI